MFYKVADSVNVTKPENTIEDMDINRVFSKNVHYLHFEKGHYETYIFRPYDVYLGYKPQLLFNYYDILLKFYYSKKGVLSGEIEIILLLRPSNTKYRCELLVELGNTYNTVKDFLQNYTLYVSVIPVEDKLLMLCSYKHSLISNEYLVYYKVCIYNGQTGLLETHFEDRIEIDYLRSDMSSYFDLFILALTCKKLALNNVKSLDVEDIKKRAGWILGAHNDHRYSSHINISRKDSAQHEAVFELINNFESIYLPYGNSFVYFFTDDETHRRYVGLTTRGIFYNDIGTRLLKTTRIVSPKSADYTNFRYQPISAPLPEIIKEKIRKNESYLHCLVQSHCKRYVLEIFDNLDNVILYKIPEGIVEEEKSFFTSVLST